MRNLRLFPATSMLGLILMVTGALTTYIALGQDSSADDAADVTEAVLPTQTLLPTAEPVIAAPAAANPVQLPVEQAAPPAQNDAPPVVVPPPVEESASQPGQAAPVEPAPEDASQPQAAPTQAEVVVQDVPLDQAAPPVDTAAPADTNDLTEQVESAALPQDTAVEPAAVEVQPEQTEVAVPTQEENLPDAPVGVAAPTVENPAPADASAPPEAEETAVVQPDSVEPTAQPESAPEGDASNPQTPPILGPAQSQDNSGEAGLATPVEQPSDLVDNGAADDPLLEATVNVEPVGEMTEVVVATPEGTLDAATAEGEILLEATEEATLTSEEMRAAIAGHIAGATQPIQGIQLALTLPDGSTVQAGVDDQGGFTFASLAPGDYVLEALAPGTLSLKTTVTVTEGQQIELPPAVLRMGDLNQDNKIDLSDIVLVAANYDGPAELAGADLNGDDQIDISDLAIIGAQFGETGPLPWG